MARINLREWLSVGSVLGAFTTWFYIQITDWRKIKELHLEVCRVKNEAIKLVDEKDRCENQSFKK